jgi:hypothetical protein
LIPVWAAYEGRNVNVFYRGDSDCDTLKNLSSVEYDTEETWLKAEKCLLCPVNLLGPLPQDDDLFLRVSNAPKDYIKRVATKMSKRNKAYLKNLLISPFLHRQPELRSRFIRGLQKRGRNVKSDLYLDQDTLWDKIVEDLQFQIGGEAV